jgi:hypothetical protein
LVLQADEPAKAGTVKMDVQLATVISSGQQEPEMWCSHLRIFHSITFAGII